MAADQADDLDKAILISFAQDGQVEESLKVKVSVNVHGPLSVSILPSACCLADEHPIHVC